MKIKKNRKLRVHLPKIKEREEYQEFPCNRSCSRIPPNIPNKRRREDGGFKQQTDNKDENTEQNGYTSGSYKNRHKESKGNHCLSEKEEKEKDYLQNNSFLYFF